MLNTIIHSLVEDRNHSSIIFDEEDDVQKVVDKGNVGDIADKDRRDETNEEKKQRDFASEMEDRIKTLFIRIAKSHGFLNGGEVSSDYVHATRSKLEVFSKKLTIK